MVIKTEGNQFCVYSEDGSRGFGCYDSREQAENRLEQIEYFKKKESKYPDDEQEFKRCWEGYEAVPGKKPYTPGSCRKKEYDYGDVVEIKEDYDDKPLNKPFRLPSGSSKKFGVYVKDGDKVKKVTFGDPDMEIRRDDDEARKNFRARHNCDTAKDKTSPRYWSCRMWEEDVTVSEAVKEENKETEFKTCFGGLLELKEISEKEYKVKGYIATTHLDGGNDKITKATLDKWAKEINEGVPRANKVSYHHDRKDKRVVGVGLKGSARVDVLPGGEYGLYVETLVNESHPDFKSIKYEVENGMTDSFSIEYIHPKSRDGYDFSGLRTLGIETELHGWTLASRPMNENAVMIKELVRGSQMEDNKQQIVEDTIQQKEKMSMKPSDEKKKKKARGMEEEEYIEKEDMQEEKRDMEEDHNKKMDSDKKKKYKEFDVQDFLESKEFNEAIEQKMKPKVLVNEEKEDNKMKIEFKEYNDAINSDNVSSRAMAAIAGRVLDAKGFTAEHLVGLKTVSAEVRRGLLERKGSPFRFDGSNKIQYKGLGLTTNENTDSDYSGLSAAELQDVFDPVIINALNETDVFWNRLAKDDLSRKGNNQVQFVLKTGANDTAGAYTGNAVSLGNTERLKFQTKFKKYQAGVQVDGDMIAAAQGGLVGDVFAQEVADATETLRSTINIDLYTEQGLETDAKIIGLKYLTDSAGNGTLYNVTRSATNKLAYSSPTDQYIDGSGGLTKELLRQAIRTVLKDGSQPSNLLFVMDHIQGDKLKELFDNAQQYNPTAANFGFTGQLVFEGIPVLLDKDCPDDSIFLVDLKHHRVGMWVPPTLEMLGKDDDSEKGFIKTYFAVYNNAPRRLAEIHSLPTA